MRKSSTNQVPGAYTLSLIVAPHTVAVLRALTSHSLSVPELCERAGGAPRELRQALAQLRKAHAVKRAGSGITARYSITSTGVELLDVGASVESWLAAHPDGPHPLDGESAREIVHTLIEGKASGVLDALADGPRTLDEIVAHARSRP